jgi:catechol 2,3-dioxygenase-like lactoylglutathione lyase family enzyme
MTLQHVTFEVIPDHVEPHIAFWALLGYEVIETPEPLRGRAIWMRREQSDVHLLIDDAPVVPPRAHAAFVIDDWDRRLAALHDAGYESSPAMRLWESERVYLRAPGGHRVEIMSAPPPLD